MSLVLSHVLSSPYPPSRAQVASQVGLTRATATKLSDELVIGKILEEAPPPPVQGPGRPAQVLKGSRHFVGIGLDIGVQSQRVVAIDLRGEEQAVEVQTMDLRASNPSEVIPLLADLVGETCHSLSNRSNIVGLTISVPGLVDTESGTLLDAPNLGWHDIHLRSMFQDALTVAGMTNSRPIPAIGNEANLSALAVAYATPGAPSRFRNFAYISGGIGVGAAVVSEHKILTGEHGWAGEIGHLTVDPHGIPCRCGSNGCLERYVGAEALESVLEKGSRDELETSARALGIAIATIVNLFDVSTVILGGTVTLLFERSQRTIYQVMRKRAMAARRKEIIVITSDIGDEAAARGAAFTSLSGLIEDPATFIDRKSQPK